MSDFKSRLLQERAELEDKVEKLGVFLQTEKVSELDEFQFTMLSIQMSAMITYLQCLIARIKKL